MEWGPRSGGGERSGDGGGIGFADAARFLERDPRCGPALRGSCGSLPSDVTGREG